ncbi:MAG: dihydroorotate dehydrogenase electron transfer subunit [Planctomycetes bacterium]|nr:dihydroorotate dehydrogenase electron transfer subunit [Planctomycetota bacterium]
MRDDAPERRTRLHRVARVRPLSGGCFALEVEGALPVTGAGQFYMLRTEHRWPALLPRPFSLYSMGEGERGGSFLVKAVGPGTEALQACRAGDRVWVTGPLGRPFPDDVCDPVCIAGGIGVAPFLLLAQQQRERGRPQPRLLFGGRTQVALAGLHDFADLARVFPCTDDGSLGFRGLVTDLLGDLLQRGEVTVADTVFCCGPDPMMHAVAAACAARQMKCYLSLETYMACGYGVCNGCSVAVRGERFHGWPYSKTCIEGPVYCADELVG